MWRKLARINLVLGALGATPALAQVTEIYKCYDENGRPLYTSDKRDTRGKKCELVSREINVVPAPPGRKTSPGSLPKESASQRADAKGRQRDILERELASEQQLLAKTQKDLSDH